MKKFILTVMAVIICSSGVAGCGNAGHNIINLNEEQQKIYNEIESYGAECKNSEKDDTLYNIRCDIKGVKDKDKLDIELRIGKLSIDRLNLEYEKEQNLVKERQEYERNKAEYKSKRDNITLKYEDSEQKYRTDMANLDRIISQAYNDYLRKCQQADYQYGSSSNKHAMQIKEQARREMQKVTSEAEEWKRTFNELWRNRVEYDRYDELYNQADRRNKENEERIKEEYRREDENLVKEINNLKLQR